MNDVQIPYEIHITVKYAHPDDFIKVCGDLKVKPILLDLQGKAGVTVLRDVMTSSTYIGNDTSVYLEMDRIHGGLVNRGYEVVRSKIETVPWHPAAPSKKYGQLISKLEKDRKEGRYFESHISVITNDENIKKLRELSSSLNCHLSRNVFKRLDEQHYKIMLTYRSTTWFEMFSISLEKIKKKLEVSNFKFDKVIVEYALYDSKVTHDASWMVNSEKNLNLL